MELRSRGKKPLRGKAALRAWRKETGKVTLPAWRRPEAQELQRLYGGYTGVLTAFKPEKVVEIGSGYKNAVKANSPALGLMILSFPPDVNERILARLVGDTLYRLGEERRVDGADIGHIARGLLSNANFRRISMAGVMRFFMRLQNGEIETGEGWLRAGKFLQLANRYARQTMEEERQLKIEAEGERRREEEEWRAVESRRFMQAMRAYLRLKGLPDDAPWHPDREFDREDWEVFRRSWDALERARSWKRGAIQRGAREGTLKYCNELK